MTIRIVQIAHGAMNGICVCRWLTEPGTIIILGGALPGAAVTK